MTDFTIREYRPEDVPALTRLWHAVFGDPEALIASFFRLLPGMGTGAAAEAEGRVFGAAYLIDGLRTTEKKVGYLYAVAVDPAYRGRGAGAALSREIFRLGRARGAEILCTQPAEPGLFHWYEKILGVQCALRRRTETVKSAACASCAPLSAERYAQRRETLLAGAPHLSLSPAALRFQQALCEQYGGGLYAVGDAIAAAYLDDGRAVVRELIAPAGAERLSLAAALGARLAAPEVLLCSPDPTGAPYLAAAPGSIPADCVWNLSFD